MFAVNTSATSSISAKTDGKTLAAIAQPNSVEVYVLSHADQGGQPIVVEWATTVVITVTTPPRTSKETTVKITYDPEVDAIYVELRKAKPAGSVDLEDGVTADLDAEGHVIGLEVLDASERLGADPLTSLTIERLPLPLKETA